MKRFSRLFCVFLSSVVLSSYVWANPEILSVLGLSDTEASERTLSEEKMDAQIAERREIIQRRIESKSLVIQDLVAGKLTLLEAARWFHELNQSPAHFPNEYFMLYDDVSPGEKVCRQVIQWTKGEDLHLSPSQVDDLIARLEKELQAHLAQHKGVVILPGT